MSITQKEVRKSSRRLTLSLPFDAKLSIKIRPIIICSEIEHSDFAQSEFVEDCFYEKFEKIQE